MITCRQCQGEIFKDTSPGVFLHENTYKQEGADVDRDHVAVPDDDYCPKSESGEHDPDPRSLVAADGYDVEMIVDVTCRRCGRSGSAQVLREDVNW